MGIGFPSNLMKVPCCGMMFNRNRERYILSMANHIQLNNGDSISHAPGDKLTAIRKGVWLGDFALNYQNAMTRATIQAYDALPTLNILIANVERENLVRLRSTRIAKILGLANVTVDRHIRKLRQCQIIIPDAVEEGRIRAVYNWRICPYLAWKGSTEALAAYLKTLGPDHVWKTYNDPVVCG